MQRREGRAKQLKLPQNGAILLVQRRSSRHSVVPSSEPEFPWELGRISPSGRDRRALQGWGHPRGAGQTVPSCLIKRVFTSQVTGI